MEGGFVGFSDYFRPTREQLAVLNAGGFIELCQFGPAMVMHSLNVWALDEDFIGPTHPGEAAELLRRYAPAGANLEFALAAARKAQLSDHGRARVEQAAHVLGLN
jgi:hypothetical protein